MAAAIYTTTKLFTQQPNYLHSNQTIYTATKLFTQQTNYLQNKQTSDTDG
jgi:hypothetical protein